ncbi:acyl-CoA thioesterase [Martelella limonii]|uniref:acyl-CoA thioesterase n=1 Tax=Martelella limonii TaxID=1647649 RepID=UPI001580E258|nr:thioesterase family protein [Martelella limonii]
MTFEMKQKVLFKHCDPAGIVFFPRYFEMMNDCVEAFFSDVLEWPFESFVGREGVPTASIETNFVAPSLHGDHLLIALVVERVGKTSFSYRMTAHCGEQKRFETRARLVFVNDRGRPQPWPDAIKAKLERQLEPAA